ncbi:MAG: hypothetical protein D6689_12340 [Deltaproteobacteria bacterium]|nr:MAG: hypothetical protein D6689_12340 [Deltaproteobacteria bacterium]
MSLLIVSLIALAAGPLLFRAARAARGSFAALDGFVVVAIAGLMTIHVIPHAIAAAGLGSIAMALVGLLGPGLLERTLRRAARHTHTATVVLAIAGLTVHAFFDGVALAEPASGHGAHMLAVAVVLHRLPVAITVWWVLRPDRRSRLALSALAALGAATVAGYAAGDAIASLLAESWLGYFQSLVAGSVLHVVFHRPHPDLASPATGRWRIYAGAGALAALGMVAALSETHLPLHAAAEGLDVGATFFALALESAPALLLAFAMAGVVQVLLPRWTLAWMGRGRAPAQALRGMVFGLPLPICSCGVIPLYQTLVQQAVPATAAMAFLVATPELGLDAILISLPLLGPELTAARVAAAAFAAFAVGWWIGRLAPATAHGAPPAAAPAAGGESLAARVRRGLRFGFGEIVDHTGPWLLLGLAIASVVEPALRADWLAGLPAGADVALFAVLGMPSYVCASGATPLVAVLIHKGVSPGAALAFLLTGPATNVTTFGILSRLHGRRIALAFGTAMALLSIGLGLLVNAAMPAAGAIALHEAALESPSALELAALAALAAVFLASLLRQGPRGFLGQILSPYGDAGSCDHDHDHDHDHACDAPGPADRDRDAPPAPPAA